jgi:fructoselysine-6-P-deglycase FrlB-like protein
MDMLNTLKTQKNSGAREKKAYTLNEVLAILYMFTVEKLTKAQVSEITGRSKHTLQYKFLEGEIILNGKRVIRSMKRFNSTAEIFAHYKEEYKGDEDVRNRINQFKSELSGNVDELDDSIEEAAS